MNVTSPILIDMAGGMNRLPLSAEDANPVILPGITPTVQTLIRGNCATPSSSLAVDSSFYGSTTLNVAASSGATNVVMINLDKGLYTLDLELSARFLGATPAANGVPDLSFTLVQNSVIFTLLALWHIIGTATSVRRRFNLCVADTTVQLRRIQAATGVGQTMEAVFSVTIERNL